MSLTEQVLGDWRKQVRSGPLTLFYLTARLHRAEIKGPRPHTAARGGMLSGDYMNMRYRKLAGLAFRSSGTRASFG